MQNSTSKTTMESNIPVIDFSAFGLDKTEVKDEDLQNLAKEVIDVFSSVGFLYLKNHGISDDVIKAAEKVGEEFFDLDNEKKTKYTWDKIAQQGWRAQATERLHPDRPADYKEVFNIVPQNPRYWPNEEVPHFEKNIRHFCQQCDILSHRLLEVIAIGLGLERNYFTQYHNTYTRPNHTQLRLAHYPAIQDDSTIQAGQIRCGEHTDFITLTFVFQDDAGGLEVFSQNGFVPATPIEGTIVVNIADMLQRWTSDKLISTLHRVVLPEEDNLRRRPRRSMAFLVFADNDTIITCIDGSNKYPPVNCMDYVTMRLDDTYK